MLESMFSRGSIGALDALLQFAGARHRLIAANIANVDTVGYKTRDLATGPFEKSLARAFADQKASPTGIFEPGRDVLRPKVVEATDAGILKHIENNVDLDIEMAKMVKNQSLHSTAAALLAQQFSMLREAISERVA